MSFIISAGTFISFAEYQDVVDRDSRLFEENEILNDETTIEELLTRASERLLARVKSSEWWKEYNYRRNSSLNRDSRLVPSVDPLLIKARQADFTDLTVSMALADYILPKVADFANENSNERQKMLFYKEASDALFIELIESGDWYDWNDTGTVDTTDKEPVKVNLVRIR
jgi:hypothetical protein